MYLLGLVSFGLTPEYKLYLYTQIHEIVFHGKGGYTWNDIYNMPIWLRKFTFEKIKEYYEKESEEVTKQQKSLNKSNKTDISRPNISPTYSTKATKK
jgi:hypothetical protein